MYSYVNENFKIKISDHTKKTSSFIHRKRKKNVETGTPKESCDLVQCSSEIGGDAVRFGADFIVVSGLSIVFQRRKR